MVGMNFIVDTQQIISVSGKNIFTIFLSVPTFFQPQILILVSYQRSRLSPFYPHSCTHNVPSLGLFRNSIRRAEYKYISDYKILLRPLFVPWMDLITVSFLDAKYFRIVDNRALINCVVNEKLKRQDDNKIDRLVLFDPSSPLDLFQEFTSYL